MVIELDLLDDYAYLPKQVDTALYRSNGRIKVAPSGN